MNSFSLRLLTAVFFVAIMLAGLLVSQWTFYFLFLLIGGACAYEFLRLTQTKGGSAIKGALKLVLGIVLTLLPYLYYFLLRSGWWLPASTDLFALLSLMMVLVFILFFLEMNEWPGGTLQNVAFAVLSVFYIGLPLLFALYLSNDGQGFTSQIVMGIIFLTWANDTGAYLVGSRWGKRLMFAHISPKKSWEGWIGGTLSTFLVAWGASSLLDVLEPGNWLVLAGIASLFGPAGDLTESFIKRKSHVKDAGSLLPGHGGFLDRFDSLLFILPVAAFYLIQILKVK